MPLYEYQCAKCGRFEKIQKFSDKPLKVCPTCKGRDVQRLISAPAIQFKGSGWYITDYARKGGEPKGDGKGDGKAASGDGATTSEAASSSQASSTPEKSTSETSAPKGKRAPKSSTTQN